MEKVIYLHGFASSPQSKKATLFRQWFQEHGVELLTPDLTGGEFVRLTLTRQLDAIHRAAGQDEVSLIGSSMGGYLAALFAARSERVRRLALLAPAFHFASHYAANLGEEKMAQWKEQGYLEVFHYATGKPEPLSWSLMEDARFFEPEPRVTQPCLILHGVHDDVVPVSSSRAFAQGRDNVQLVEYDSNHELMNVVEDLFARTWQFLNQPDAA
jgi:predicted esterase YcpF (UPF0227 family)